MSEHADSVRQELILLARRLGIRLTEEDLEIVVPAYHRVQELQAYLRRELPLEEEPASIGARPVGEVKNEPF
ncbi:MAG: hypothetical protein M5U01_15265 [Ardenticatenaceae bacterium]|nr:hypothetical protein [Ardenticatenaceae bacterium]HBY99369.1 hypothetical protein [Chloroflexota bacterium]